MTIITNGNGGATAVPRVLNGRGFARRHANKRQRAVLAAELADGRVVVQLSVTQLVELLGVSRSYIDLARKLSPEKRRAILAGRDSTSFGLLSQRFVPAPAGIPSDESLTALAHRVGSDRWLAAGVLILGTADVTFWNSLSVSFRVPCRAPDCYPPSA
jgi:hypothetical protein